MSEIFLLRWLTLFGVLFWFVAYWQGGQKALKDIREAASLENSRLDTLLMVGIAISSLAITGTGILMGLGKLQTGITPKWGVVLSGWILSVVGIVGMFYCRHYLGRFWTAEMRLMEGHQVVDKGPYGVVRHPIYTFAMVMYVGLGLVFPGWWNELLIVLVVVSYALKAREEDRFLEERLKGCREYKERVRYRVMPWVW